MKISVLNLAYVALCCFLATGCTTSELVEQQAPQPVEKEEIKGEEITLNFEIMHNSFTRAEDSEEQIDNLYLAFYNVSDGTPQFIKLVEATSSDDNSYTAKINLLYGKPDWVIAYANVPSNVELNNALTKKVKIGQLTNESRSLVMSSASYYDYEDPHSLIYYSEITEDNLETGTPINIYLERLASKVTVTNETTQPIEISLSNGYEERTLSLTLTGWDLFGTDKNTYLHKNIEEKGYNDISQELNNASWNWNNYNNHSLNWSHSENWELTATGFPTIGNENNATTYHPQYSQVDHSFNSSAYYHETTRSSAVFETPNARPSIVLVGQYKIKGKEAQTLYRKGSVVFTEDELIEYFSKMNQTSGTQILFYYGTKVYNGTGYPGSCRYGADEIKNALKNYMFIKTLNRSSNNPNMVTLQVSLTAPDKNKLCKNDKNNTAIQLSEIDGINQQLVEAMGLWEVYENGKCFFHIPVEHTGKATDSNGSKTGSYGLVRNHHYNISIKNIEGMGIGVPSDDTYIGEWEYQEGSEIFKDVKYNISINSWNDVNQDVNIPKK